MLNNVGEAETLLATPDGAARSTTQHRPAAAILDLAATLARISSGKIGEMA